MPTPVEVPKLGNTVEECLIARWAKHKGDSVTAGDLVCEIETDKATFEVTAPVDGTILETLFDEGAYVPVFTTIFTIGDAGEAVASNAPAALGHTGQAAAGRAPAPASVVPTPATDPAAPIVASPPATAVPPLSP